MRIDPALFEENERTANSVDSLLCDTGALNCESGGRLESTQTAYMTWGALNADRSNAILVCHALSGNANCVHWWDRIVGPGNAIDTEKCFVVGVNALGGCDGSTGPASMAGDGKPYGSRFPLLTVGDMVECQNKLRESLGIQKWSCVCGGSMGGMQALEWSVRFPDNVSSVWATASCAAHSAMQIGFNESARQAIQRDANWKSGDYYDNEAPVNGLSVARMIGHLSFLSDAAFEAKFGRRLQNKDDFEFGLNPEFQVESYLNYQGDKFGIRFDANSLLILTRAIDYFDLKSLEPATCRFLFTSFSSDWLYPTHQSKRLLEMAAEAGLQANHVEIDLPFGHDAFLLDGDQQGSIVRDFLDS